MQCAELGEVGAQDETFQAVCLLLAHLAPYRAVFCMKTTGVESDSQERQLENSCSRLQRGTVTS